MNEVERMSDNDDYRELTVLTSKNCFNYVFMKKTKKIEIDIMDIDYKKTNRLKMLPNIHIKDMLWLINGKQEETK